MTAPNASFVTHLECSETGEHYPSGVLHGLSRARGGMTKAKAGAPDPWYELTTEEYILVVRLQPFTVSNSSGSGLALGGFAQAGDPTAAQPGKEGSFGLPGGAAANRRNNGE